jgi:predicted nucleotidyltransferase
MGVAFIDKLPIGFYESIRSTTWLLYNHLEGIMDDIYSVPTIEVRERIPMKVIHDLARRIADKFHPRRIILFGSYAYGDPRPESDVDLLVIMDQKPGDTNQSLQIRRYLHVLFGLDLLVYTPERLAQRISWGDSFLKEITERGTVLYESTDS